MSESEFFMRTIGSSSSSQRTSTRSPTFTSGTLCFFFSCAPPVRATSSTSPPSFSSLVRFLPTSAVSSPLTLSLSLFTSPSLPHPTPPPPRLTFTGGETGTPHGSAGEFIPSAFRASILSLTSFKHCQIPPHNINFFSAKTAKWCPNQGFTKEIQNPATRPSTAR